MEQVAYVVSGFFVFFLGTSLQIWRKQNDVTSEITYTYIIVSQIMSAV